MSADPWGPLLLQLVLILFSGWFAATEVAILSLNELKLRTDAEEGDKIAAKLLKLTEAPNKFLSTIQVCITLAGFLGAAFAAQAFSEPLMQWLVNLGVTLEAELLHTLCVVAITLILAYASPACPSASLIRSVTRCATFSSRSALKGKSA